MKKNLKVKQHANHNEKVCFHLFEQNEFNDWVVTTSFYSALHYVNFCIFPFREKGEEIKNLVEFRNSYKKKNGKDISKHDATKLLANNKISSIGGKYNMLYDLCQNARYHNYEVPDFVSKMAVGLLKEIKAECLK